MTKLYYPLYWTFVTGRNLSAADYLNYLDIKPQHGTQLKLMDNTTLYQTDVDLVGKTMELERAVYKPTPDVKNQHWHSATNVFKKSGKQRWWVCITSTKAGIRVETLSNPKRNHYLINFQTQVSPQGALNFAYARWNEIGHQQMILILRGDEFPPNQRNKTSQVFQKFNKHRKYFVVDNHIMYCTFYIPLKRGNAQPFFETRQELKKR